MKRIVTAILALLFLVSTSELASAKGGHYRGGRGSSHKGGSYKNKKTGDRYQKRGSSSRPSGSKKR